MPYYNELALEFSRRRYQKLAQKRSAPRDMQLQVFDPAYGKADRRSEDM